MTDSSNVFQEIKLALKLAITRHQFLKQELVDAKKINQQLSVEKQKLEEEIKQLQEQVKTIKLAQALNGSDDQSTREVKNQINRYIREIDKCLNLINRD